MIRFLAAAVLLVWTVAAITYHAYTRRPPADFPAYDADHFS